MRQAHFNLIGLSSALAACFALRAQPQAIFALIALFFSLLVFQLFLFASRKYWLRSYRPLLVLLIASTVVSAGILAKEELVIWTNPMVIASALLFSCAVIGAPVYHKIWNLIFVVAFLTVTGALMRYPAARQFPGILFFIAAVMFAVFSRPGRETAAAR